MMWEFQTYTTDEDEIAESDRTSHVRPQERDLLTYVRSNPGPTSEFPYQEDQGSPSVSQHRDGDGSFNVVQFSCFFLPVLPVKCSCNENSIVWNFALNS